MAQPSAPADQPLDHPRFDDVPGERVPRLIDRKELADFLHVSLDWVSEGVESRTLPHTKLRKLVRFTPAQVQQILKAAERPVIDSSSRKVPSPRRSSLRRTSGCDGCCPD